MASLCFCVLEVGWGQNLLSVADLFLQFEYIKHIHGKTKQTKIKPSSREGY